MSRIEGAFRRLRAQGRKALIPFITAGDPHPSLTVPLMHALVRGGADIIELGVPFSDPMADGPTVQRASERALKHGVTLARVLATVSEFRQADPNTPVVLMGYANPIEAMGVSAFVVKHPAQVWMACWWSITRRRNAAEFAATLKAADMDPIFLLAPTSTEKRFRRRGGGRQRLHLLRLAQGRDGVRQARSRRCRQASAAHTRDGRHAGRRRLRHPRRAQARRALPPLPTRW